MISATPAAASTTTAPITNDTDRNARRGEVWIHVLSSIAGTRCTGMM